MNGLEGGERSEKVRYQCKEHREGKRKKGKRKQSRRGKKGSRKGEFATGEEGVVTLCK